VSDELIVFCRGGCGKAGNSRIDPPDGVKDIRAVNGYVMADEKIFREIDLDPPGVIFFFFDAPSPFPNGPDLKRRLQGRTAESRGNRRKRQKKHEQNQFH
jgi:hypothetical protein